VTAHGRRDGHGVQLAAAAGQHAATPASQYCGVDFPSASSRETEVLGCTTRDYFFQVQTDVMLFFFFDLQM
jgi:hypothetical protein